MRSGSTACGPTPSGSERGRKGHTQAAISGKQRLMRAFDLSLPGGKAEHAVVGCLLVPASIGELEGLLVATLFL
jgi:hypothetical protein